MSTVAELARCFLVTVAPYTAHMPPINVTALFVDPKVSVDSSSSGWNGAIHLRGSAQAGNDSPDVRIEVVEGKVTRIAAHWSDAAGKVAHSTSFQGKQGVVQAFTTTTRDGVKLGPTVNTTVPDGGILALDRAVGRCALDVVKQAMTSAP